MSEVYEKMSEVLIAGNIEEIKKLTQEALDWGIQAQEILEKGVI